jgi:phosphoserine phosphatase RsbU/P
MASPELRPRNSELNLVWRPRNSGTDGNGFTLGIASDAEYRQVSLDLEPGDVILIYSDGVTDAQGGRGERYDSTENPRLRDRLSRAGDSPKAIRQSIIRDIEVFSAGPAQFDDVTLICFGPVAPAGFQPDRTERYRT